MDSLSETNAITVDGVFRTMSDDYLENLAHDAIQYHATKESIEQHCIHKMKICLPSQVYQGFVTQLPITNELLEVAMKNNKIAMPFNLEALKLLNNNIRYIVFGYMRKQQQNLSNINKNNNPYYNIPELISQLILYYYFRLSSECIYCLNAENTKFKDIKNDKITTFGDSHMIPHDFLDNLLEDAVTQNTTKELRINYIENKLSKGLPSPVAQTLAETLVNSITDDQDNDDIHDIDNSNDVNYNTNNDDNNHYNNTMDIGNDNDNNNNNIVNMPVNGDNDNEWQISFVYEPFTNDVPINPPPSDQMANIPERRLSINRSPETWGIVPPQYFESPEQSFLRQALGREVALDMLEGFFPNQENVNNLLNNPVINLNDGQQDNWLRDLYELGEDVRKKHTILECAISDLKSQLNVPPVLADVVTRDVMDELENVDPYFGTLKEKEIYFKLDELKMLDNDTKYTVFGFIRNCKILLGNNNNNPYFDIPQLIYWLTLFYYHWIKSKDFIFPCKCGHDVQYDPQKSLDETIDSDAYIEDNAFATQENVDLSDLAIEPESWLYDLYGLADEIRKNHSNFNCAVLDLKSQLNVASNVADVVAKDVMDEIEIVDPYLNKNDMDDDEEEMHDEKIQFNENELRLLDNNEKYVIYGYIRIYDEENVPQLVYDLVLYYYHYIKLYDCICVRK